MKHIFAVFKKELKSYVDHPMAYILAVVFLVINNFLFSRNVIFQNDASLRAMFSLLPWILIFFVSALTMRTWAEERKQQTLQALISYPVKVWEIIAGKYLATVVFVSVVMFLTLSIPFTLSSAGSFSWGVIIAQYLGATLMAMAMIAIGQWASSLTNNQVIAFIISLAILFGFFLVGLETVTISLAYPFNTIAQQLGLLSHFNSMSRGLIDVRDVLYFLSVAAIFLVLSYGWLVKLKSAVKSKEWKTLQTSLIVFIAIAVVINLFGQRFTLRADLTESNIYSLSPVTKRVLADLNDSVRFTLYRSKKLPAEVESLSRDVQDILGDYQKFGGKNVDYSIVYAEGDDLDQVKKAGIPAIQFNVVKQDQFTLQEGYFGLVIEVLDKKESIPFIQSISDFEYRLTRAMVQMQQESKPKVGYITDFGAIDISQLAYAKDIRDNYTLQKVTLVPPTDENGVQASVPVQIDPSIDALIVSGPTEPFSAQAIAAIQDYIDQGGNILWALNGANVDQQTLNVAAADTGLDALLAVQGITIKKDIIGDLVSHETITFSNGIVSYLLPYPYWIRASLNKHQLVGNLQQVVMPWSSSISIDGPSDNIKPFIVTSNQSISQNAGMSINPNTLPDFTKMDQLTYTLGLTIEDIPSKNDGELGRWVVISNGQFFNDQMTSQFVQNASLMLNSIDWLSQNDLLLSIRSKQIEPNQLAWKSPSQQAFVKWFNSAGMPVLVVIGGAIWLYRRRRKIYSSAAKMN